MKFALLFVVLIPFTLSAQFVKGDKFIGGSAGFNIQRPSQHPNFTNVNESNSFFISPEIGFFTRNNFAIGTEIQYSHQTNRYTSTDGTVEETKLAGYGLSIFAKKYYFITDQFSFALKGSTGYRRSIVKDFTTTNVQDVHYHAITAAISPAFTFFPSSDWGFEAGLGGLTYSFSKYVGSAQAGHRLNFNAGLISFGLKYFIRSKEE